MKCRKCESNLILKSTCDLHGVLSFFWKCPVCGFEQVDESRCRDVILK